MSPVIGLTLLGLACLAGLVLIALGLPGLWVEVIAVIGYGWIGGFRAIGLATMGVVFGLAVVGELMELWLGFGFAKRYGGSKRAGWGALVGGLVGAAVGVPVPVIGSVIGALVGSFVGAALFEYSRTWTTETAMRAGWGALLGRIGATTVKMGLGIAIAVVAAFAVLRG